ncbi:unnamed protein product [Hymenolepis diminuta]|uniref:Uncharacterized protein n=1 Tax=Hymenolepis diminuta TaxID=6216 RepID=A0A564YD07_HYMDI|nr:unnamed protein product [Hymenolepis diminuta]VUZ45159.1 unnamed protein product [Hymenolepis diminuta]VUZ45162.1 unnamed protein product [Hymenolepis diminuta]
MATVFVWLLKVCRSDVCCRILGMVEASGKITLEDIVHDFLNSNIKVDSDVNQVQVQVRVQVFLSSFQ